MKYGLIGEKLGHSFSKEIHETIAGYRYEKCEIARDELPAFLEKKDFLGINVTIPYKESVIPFLDDIDEAARQIGAVNTVINRDGRLLGFNTDFFGMRDLITESGADISGKKTVILGTGGTSKTAGAVASSLGAGEILFVSRRPSEKSITYEQLCKYHSDAEVIINTTPVGMYPNAFSSPVDLSCFDRLYAVFDAVYNPLRTPLILAAKRRGIIAEGGLYMLVLQAVRASEIFLDTSCERTEAKRIYEGLLSKKENIVLTGMPASGKTTVGRLLSEKTGMELIDTDELIERKTGIRIPEIFEKYGEAGFRDLESDAVKEASLLTSRIIATGGGAVLRRENIEALKENGRIYFLDRPLGSLIPTDSRPLSSDKEAMAQRYRERYPIYSSTADRRIISEGTPEDTALAILLDRKQKEAKK